MPSLGALSLPLAAQGSKRQPAIGRESSEEVYCMSVRAIVCDYLLPSHVPNYPRALVT